MNNNLIHQVMQEIDNNNFNKARLLISYLGYKKGYQLYTCKKVMEASSNTELRDIANRWFNYSI